jgi:hypothetical protein
MSTRFWPVAAAGRRAASLLLVLLPFAAALLPAGGQQMHRNSFEGHKPCWSKGATDADYEETIHAMSDQGAHDGQRSEYLQIQVKRGSYIFYQYPTARAPITEEFNAGLWVKSNRRDVQLMARLVLPREKDPGNLNDRMTVILRGDVNKNAVNGGGLYTTVGRWQRLELGRVVRLCKEQQLLMQKQLGRAVDFTDAYIDTLLLNVFTGPGTTEVWIDELEMGPVLENIAPPVAAVSNPKAVATIAAGPGLVKYDGGHLFVGDRRVFFRGIRHTDTPIRTLRDAGFNTLLFEPNAGREELRQAVESGFYLVPALPVAETDSRLVSDQDVTQAVRNYAMAEHVLFWNLGNALAYEQTNLVDHAARLVRPASDRRPLGVDAWDGLVRYANSVDLVGVHRWPLLTGMELTQYRDWLDQRGRLAGGGAFLWTWVQTHLPDYFTKQVYDRPASAGFTEPVGPQPEQIRLLTYTALGAGCRGLAYWSDRFLADSHQGRDRLLTLALLNQELEMLEPLLVQMDTEPVWIETSSPDVSAAVMRCHNAVLVLPVWMGQGAQFVPGQAAVSKLSLTVPHVPQSWQAWEVSPGDTRSYIAQRVPMGTKVTLPEFGLTTALVFTADTKLIVRFQELARVRREKAAEWTYSLAVKELEKVEQVEAQLTKLGQSQPDEAALLQDARDRLQTARQFWKDGMYSDAYHEAQRALRPVRILMRAQWEKATKTLGTPVASPYAVSYYTLPRHLEFMAQIGKTTPAANLLPDGDFEVIPGRPQQAWSPQDVTLDPVVLRAERVKEVWMREVKKDKDADGNPLPPPKIPPKFLPKKLTGPAKEGKQCLLLEIKPKDPLVVPEALDRTFLAINSPMMSLPPGTLVRVSGWMLIPDPIRASPDGALFYDSAGGEPLAVRRMQTNGWEQFRLYRRVPASGTFNVTLALTGIGTVFFDDVRVEPLIPTPSQAAPRTPAGALTPVPVVGANK